MQLQLALVALLPLALSACQIVGYESGVCLNTASIAPQLPFCRDSVGASVCVPDSFGRTHFVSMNQKDSVLYSFYIRRLAQVFEAQLGGTSTSSSLIVNQDCPSAFKTLLCSWNFPACDANGKTVPLDCNICIAFVTHCGLFTDLCTQFLATEVPSKAPRSPKLSPLTQSTFFPLRPGVWGLGFGVWG